MILDTIRSLPPSNYFKAFNVVALVDVENAPRWLRIVPGIVGAGLLLKLFRPDLGIILPLHLLKTIFVFIFIVVVFTVIFSKRNWSGRRIGNIEICRSYIVKARDSDSAEKIIDVVRERVKRGYSDYIMLSFFDKDGNGYTKLLLCGRTDLVDREADIFETIIASLVKGGRLESEREVDASPIFGLLGIAGPSRNSLLLSPITRDPSKQRKNIDGIYLGDSLETPLPEPVYLSSEDIEGHVGIYGSTGSGKSTTLRTIAYQAEKFAWRVVILDWTGEHAIHDPVNTFRPVLGEFPVPLLELASTREGRSLLVDLLTSSLGLTDPQSYLLSRILETPIASISELLARLDAWPEESGWDREVKRGLKRKLAPLTGVERVFQGKFSINRGRVIVDASSIRSPRLRKVYALSLLSYLYFYVRERSERVVVAIDEAHNLFEGESRLFEELLSESRKYGLHVVYATQAPSLVPDRVFLNTNTKIVHALRSQRDKQAVQATMSLDEYMVHLLDKLVRGEALVQAPSITKPVLVKVKSISPGGDIIDEAGINR